MMYLRRVRIRFGEVGSQIMSLHAFDKAVVGVSSSAQEITLKDRRPAPYIRVYYLACRE
jgi:hypothetical protein